MPRVSHGFCNCTGGQLIPSPLSIMTSPGGGSSPPTPHSPRLLHSTATADPIDQVQPFSPSPLLHPSSLSSTKRAATPLEDEASNPAIQEVERQGNKQVSSLPSTYYRFGRSDRLLYRT